MHVFLVGSSVPHHSVSVLHHLMRLSGRRRFPIPLLLRVFQIVFQYYNTRVYLCFATAFLSTKKTKNRCEMLLKRPFSLLDFGVTQMHQNT
jgi:hypothetical protein